jgi:hypothetical protein
MTPRTPTTSRRLTRIAALVLAAGGLAACENGMSMPFGAAETTGAAFFPLSSEQEFRQELVGREVVYANGNVGTYGNDNTWRVADAAGNPVASGTWTWRGDQWCFEGTAPQGPVSGCEQVAVSVDSVRFIRDDGSFGTLPFRT